MSLQTLAEQLVGEIDIKLREVDELEVRQKSITTYETLLRKKMDAVRVRELGLTNLAEDIKKEREFVTRQVTELQKKEDIALKLIAQTEEVKRQQAALEEQRQVIGKKDLELKEEAARLEQKRKEVELKEAHLIRIQSVDNERKERLDQQEKENEKERERLQRIATQFK